MSYDTLDACEDAVRQRLKREMVLIKITPLSGPASNTRPIATYSALWPIKRLKLYLRTRRMPARIFRAGRPYMRSTIVRSGHRAKAISRASVTSPSPRPRYTAAIGEYQQREPDRRNAHEWRVRTIDIVLVARWGTACTPRCLRIPRGTSTASSCPISLAVIGAIGTCFRTARGDLSRCRWAVMGLVILQPQILSQTPEHAVKRNFV